MGGRYALYGPISRHRNNKIDEDLPDDLAEFHAIAELDALSANDNRLTPSRVAFSVDPLR